MSVHAHRARFPVLSASRAVEAPLRRFTLAVPHDARSRLALGWFALGIAALAASGILAVLLVLSRTPVLASFFPVANFFHTALVAHVDLSVLVWFVAFAGTLWSLNSTPRMLPLGWAALAGATAGSAMIAFAPFVGGTPIMSNYVPVIDSPAFLWGLAVLGSGNDVPRRARPVRIAARRHSPRRRRRAALRPQCRDRRCRRRSARARLVLGRTAARARCQGVLRAAVLGSGHVLQFAWTLLLLVAWLLLADAVGARAPLSPRVVALLFGVGLVCVFITPLIYYAYDIATVPHHRLQTWLMRFGGGLAIAPVAVAVVWSLLRQDRRSVGANRDAAPLRAALVTSILLFGAGGLIGYAIHGSNVRVPAHYHGAIVGVTIALMGVAYWLLPRFGFAAPPPRLATWQPCLYGGGQLLHIVGLVWSGGYGVQRKIADGGAVMRPLEQTIGMGMMGIGGLIAVAGGMLFVAIVIVAVIKRPRARSNANA